MPCNRGSAIDASLFQPPMQGRALGHTIFASEAVIQHSSSKTTRSEPDLAKSQPSDKPQPQHHQE